MEKVEKAVEKMDISKQKTRDPIFSVGVIDSEEKFEEVSETFKNLKDQVARMEFAGKNVPKVMYRRLFDMMSRMDDYLERDEDEYDREREADRIYNNDGYQEEDYDYGLEILRQASRITNVRESTDKISRIEMPKKQ